MRVTFRQYREFLARYLWPQWPRVLLLVVLLLVSVALQLVGPQVVRYFIDGALAGAPLAALLAAGVGFLAVGLVQQICTVAVTWVGENVGWNATNRLRADLTRHCLGLEMGFHHERTPGELIERIDGDATALSNFFSQFLLKVVGSGLLLVGVVAVVTAEDWRAGAALALFVAMSALALARSRDIAVEAVREERQVSAELFGFLEERLAGLDDLRANGAGPYAMRRFWQVMGRLFVRGRHASMRRSLVWLITLGLFTLSSVLAFGLGAYLYLAGAITLGTAYLFFQYTELLQSPLEQLTSELQDLQRAAASLGRIVELSQIDSRLAEGSAGREALPDGPLAVRFEAVDFAYAPGKPVIEQLSFDLPAGQVLGLLGRTGSGKTTLTRLLLRLWEPQAGSVRLGGLDVASLTAAALRERVGVVTQDVQLFHASVRDNVTFFDATIPDERVREALERAELGSWLAGLPRGLDSELASGGRGLSAGEAQLLAFARVLLKDPGLVILDEPSSRLDPATEARIERAVHRLLAGRTGIIIAHRLSTVRRVDRILILEGGQILEAGPRAALAADPHSRFARLLATDLEEVLV
ncbi:ABC transporter ATP-binding protein [Gloeobacter morelensis]|uniref:ABC transporter ATP-binding protein n=1 Tax=Gloeobacter morelensis MG652769 TaxID=2781736 RepID=A0ABY3PLM4_9CYAN|nr:ABC transporter ATP-binding protein [Gloeobacter morelensis]UFP94607.1 ABC transporter ATP-binding protein [Gloeobacter morelensis MG652769]